MDTSSSANSGSPDRESIAFTPIQNKFQGFVPRIIGLSPRSILSEGPDDEYEEKNLRRLFGFDCHPALLNLPSITSDLLFPKGILVSNPVAIQEHKAFASSRTNPTAEITALEEPPTRILKIGNIQNIAAPHLFKILQVRIIEGPEALLIISRMKGIFKHSTRGCSINRESSLLLLLNSSRLL